MLLFKLILLGFIVYASYDQQANHQQAYLNPHQCQLAHKSLQFSQLSYCTVRKRTLEPLQDRLNTV